MSWDIWRRLNNTLKATKIVLFIWLSIHCINTGATTITLNILDGPSSGLNDPTLTSPTGGNRGTTIGEQRQIAFSFATGLIETIFDSSITITIDASFASLSCNSSTATLGNGGPNTVHHRNSAVPPIPLPESNTWYVGALANAYDGSDLSGSSDMNLTFNADIDNNNSCLNNRNWYYGLDGNAPGSDIDFLTTVLHEILHGLGFLSLIDLITGSEFSGRTDAYSRFLEDHSIVKNWHQMNDGERMASTTDLPDLHWTGANVQAASGGLTGGIDQGHVRMYAPASLNTGSSVSHFSTSLSPNELMEPIQTGEKENIGLAQALLEDIGWTIFGTQPPIVGKLADTTILNAATTSVDIAVIDNDDAISSLTLSATSSNTAIISNANLITSGSGRLRQLNITPQTGESGNVDITVTVSDGTSSINTQFSVAVVSDFTPSVTIIDPVNFHVFYSAPQLFTGTANDTEDGDIGAQIQWASSIDGALGTGSNISPSLTDGIHTIAASITDSQSNNENTDISVTVDLLGDADGDGLINSLEIALGTNPNSADSDNDFLSDFDEVNMDGDPSSYTPGTDTDPNNNDTDGDGSLDGVDIEPLIPNDPMNVPVLPPLYLMVLFAAICVLSICANKQSGTR